nr:FKBP-type peptidyl-prolyl cis-trans isomerase [Rothia sp. ZJ1223]
MVTASPGTATNVEVYTVARKIPSIVEGEQKDLGESKPKFSLEGNNATIALPENKGDEPLELVSDVLIEGNGQTVNKGDTLFVRYLGVTWNNGEVFDGNYAEGAAPASFPLNENLIKGWVDGLQGQKVGSRVMLTIPTEMAYGANAAQNKAPEGPLVFVIDLLGSVEGTAPAETSAPSSSAAASESPAPAESANDMAPAGDAPPSESAPADAPAAEPSPSE